MAAVPVLSHMLENAGSSGLREEHTSSMSLLLVGCLDLCFKKRLESDLEQRRILDPAPTEYPVPGPCHLFSARRHSRTRECSVDSRVRRERFAVPPPRTGQLKQSVRGPLALFHLHWLSNWLQEARSKRGERSTR